MHSAFKAPLTVEKVITTLQTALKCLLDLQHLLEHGNCHLFRLAKYNYIDQKQICFYFALLQLVFYFLFATDSHCYAIIVRLEKYTMECLMRLHRIRGHIHLAIMTFNCIRQKENEMMEGSKHFLSHCNFFQSADTFVRIWRGVWTQTHPSNEHLNINVNCTWYHNIYCRPY